MDFIFSRGMPALKTWLHFLVEGGFDDSVPVYIGLLFLELIHRLASQCREFPEFTVVLNEFRISLSLF